MTIREQLEAREEEYLSPYATLSRNSRGRERMKNSVISALSSRETETGYFIVKHSGD